VPNFIGELTHASINPGVSRQKLAKVDLLQVLLVAIFSGFAIANMGKPGEQIASAARCFSASSA
jgi:Na+/H+-dicarboxylate symporter